MNDLQLIEQKARLKESLKTYKGEDRVIVAKDKLANIKQEALFRPPFKAVTGIPLLDECLDGFRLGQLIVISGPPKQGKSYLCQHFTMKFVDQGHQCLWLEYELGYEEFFERFPQHYQEKFDFLIPNYMQSGNLEWVEHRIIEAKEKNPNLKAVFIDHLDFLRDPDILKGVSYNLASYIGGIVQKVKRIAVENEVVIFLMSHIRKNQWTTNDLPSSEELRDTGQTAQLADIVMMIIRKRMPKSSNEIYDTNKAIVGVIENRLNGKTKKASVQLKDGFYVEELYTPTETRSNPTFDDDSEFTAIKDIGIF